MMKKKSKIEVNRLSKKGENIRLNESEQNQDPESDNKDNPKRKKYNRGLRKKPVIVAVIITVMLAMGLSYSWYLFTKDNHADREDVEVMTPYFLYLLNPTDHDKMQLSVGNIYPNETKKVVVCVSNQRPTSGTGDNRSVEIARTSDFKYDLELIYTSNIPVNYTIYELDELDSSTVDPTDSNIISVTGKEPKRDDSTPQQDITMYFSKRVNTTDNAEYPALSVEDVTSTRVSSVFGSDDLSEVVNVGTYNLYKKDATGEEDLSLHYDAEENVYDYDYFMIEISWKDENITFDKYTKETDLLYVVVNAKQPEPKRQSS